MGRNCHHHLSSIEAQETQIVREQDTLLLTAVMTNVILSMISVFSLLLTFLQKT